ncbi:MAG: DNA repair protein RecO [Proteobacteria bacterium]|nr:DNA repair protein RecO [Pseudomonadota bacterium]
MKVELTQCYILHTRPFKDSSALVECFSEEHGLVTLIAKGAKRPRSRMQGLVQPFMLLQVSWTGKAELKTLTHIEAAALYPKLSGQKILLGWYLNELLIRMLQHQDAHPDLFREYDKTISAIAHSENENQLQMILRQFELKLLAELGYGLDLFHDAKTHAPIAPELLYSYDPNLGMYEVSSAGSIAQQLCVSGASLIALQTGVCENETQLKETKKLMRFVLGHYLGNKPLQSRKLFQSTIKGVSENA